MPKSEIIKQAYIKETYHFPQHYKPRTQNEEMKKTSLPYVERNDDHEKTTLY